MRWWLVVLIQTPYTSFSTRSPVYATASLADASCGCRAGGAVPSRWGVVVLLGLTLLVRRRR